MLNKIKISLKYYYVELIHNNFIISNLRGFKHLWKLGDVVNGYVDYCKFKHTIKNELKDFKEEFKRSESFNNSMFDSLENRIDFVEGMVEDLDTTPKILKTPFGGFSNKDDEPINAHLSDKVIHRSIGEQEALKRVAKVLGAYDNCVIDDIIDDINDEFIGFNDIYIDINLGN